MNCGSSGIRSGSRGGSGTRAEFVFVFEFESMLHEGVSGTLEEGALRALVNCRVRMLAREDEPVASQVF